MRWHTSSVTKLYFEHVNTFHNTVRAVWSPNGVHSNSRASSLPLTNLREQLVEAEMPMEDATGEGTNLAHGHAEHS
jgi:hypothetical protein